MVSLKKLVKTLRAIEECPQTYFLMAEDTKEWFLLMAAMEFGVAVGSVKGLSSNLKKMTKLIDELAMKWLKPKKTVAGKRVAGKAVLDCYEKIQSLPTKDQVFLLETVKAAYDFQTTFNKAYESGK